MCTRERYGEDTAEATFEHAPSRAAVGLPGADEDPRRACDPAAAAPQGLQEARPDPPDLTSPHAFEIPRAPARALCALALACAVAAGATYPKPQAGTAGKGRLEYVQGIPVLHLRGTPEEMGRQQGKLLGKQFAVLRELYLKRFLGGAGTQLDAAKLAAMGFQQYVPKEYLDELKALAAASGEQYVDVLLANTFLDISRLTHCSVVIAHKSATRDGRLLFARNNDFLPLGIAHKASLVTVYHHAGPGRRPFVAIGWPGIVGVLSGTNDAGLCVATLVSLTQQGVQPGLPYCLMYRRVLELCATPDEAVALVERTRRTSANNLAVAGPRGEPVVIEFSPQRVAVRRPIRDVLLCTNHFRSKAHTPEPKPVFWRFPRIEKLSQEHHGRIDVAACKLMLQACQMRDWTMQSMVFEPAERRVHLSVGRMPAASGPYVILDCKRLLAGK